MIAEYQVGVLLILSVMAFMALINVFSIRSLGGDPAPVRTPLVSVLIPARNEEESIDRCLRGMTAQDYPNLEITVLDDNSDDGTSSVVRHWAGVDSRVRLIQGTPLPAGWVGKNYACHQLARAAQGEVLLFVDADTIHGPQSVSNGVAALEHAKAGLVTVIPYQIMESFWERTILPMLHFSTFCFLPFPLVNLLRDPRFAMANGQYMMFTRSAYDAIGGHDAVKDVMVEDVWLSRSVKREGFRLRILEGGKSVSCRMYSSLGGIWRGFSKNLFAGFRFSIPAISAVIVFNILTSILPYGVLAGIAAGLLPAAQLPVVSAQVILLFGIRIVLSARFRMSVRSVLLHPLGMAMVVAIAVNSVRWVLFAGGTKWKGRAYVYKNQVLAAMRSEQ